MDYLITGATGFIGRKLVDRLLSAGHEVNYLARQRSAMLDSRAAFHCWNAGEKPPLESVPTFDAVIHLAGERVAQRWSRTVKDRIYNSRVEGTRALVSALGGLKHKPAALVCASATGYYGNRSDEILTETSPPGDGFLAHVCVDWEREALRARELGIRVVCLRTAPVLGRDGGVLEKMLGPFRLGIGGKLGNGRQWMPWIHIEDLLHLITFAAENGSVSGPVNAASPKPVTNAEFTQRLARAVSRPAVLSIPRLALKAALGELADNLFDSARVIPEAAQEARFQFEFPDLTQAFYDLLRSGP